MPELKDLFTGVLRETLNLDEEKVASLFNEDGTVKDDAQATILQWNSDHVKTLKSTSQKTSFDDGYKKAQSEVLSKFETDFKAKTGFKSDKKGIELMTEYAASLKPGELNDDAVKKHPIYLTLQEQSEAAIAAAKEEGETKLTQFQKELSKKDTFKTVAQKALEIFHSQKPILSKDPIKAKAQEELFIEKLQGFEYEMQGDRIVVLKDGKIYENGQGHAIPFDKLIKETSAKYYDFHVADPKASPANKTPAAGEKKTYEVPKSDDEYNKFIADTSIPVEDRMAMKESYSKK